MQKAIIQLKMRGINSQKFFRNFFVSLKFNKNNLLEAMAVALGGFIVNSWALNRLNAYGMDDYDFIYKSMFVKLNFTILPQFPYNDRPVRDWFNSLLFWIFGSNFQIQHLILVLIHILNGILLFIILKLIIKRSGRTKGPVTYIPFIASFIFTAWPKNFTTFWISASNDLLLVTFFLLCALAYYFFVWASNERQKLVYGTLTIISFWLAVRTKEAAVFIPFILIFAKLALNLEGKKLKETPVKIKQVVERFDISFLALSVFFVIRLALLQRGKKMVSDPSDFYYYSLNMIGMIKKLAKYTIMYFDFSNEYMGWVITNRGIVYLISFGLLSLVFFGLFIMQKKKYLLATLFVLYGTSIVTILPLANMQHILYLYFPSIFLSLIMAVLVCYLAELVKIEKRIPKAYLYGCLVFLTISFASTAMVQNFRTFWIVYSQRDQSIIKDLKIMEKPKEGTVFYLLNTDKNIHLFKNGDAGLLNIVFNTDKVKAVIIPDVKEIKDKSNYRILSLDYEKGHIYEVGRSND